VVSFQAQPLAAAPSATAVVKPAPPTNTAPPKATASPAAAKPTAAPVKPAGSAPTKPVAPKPATAKPASRKPGSGRGVPPRTKDDCPNTYPIKGNKTTQNPGDWIYHAPGSRNYASTDPEECFATTADAQAAGYRAPLN
jgi:hypothetical protein